MYTIGRSGRNGGKNQSGMSLHDKCVFEYICTCIRIFVCHSKLDLTDLNRFVLDTLECIFGCIGD